MRGVRELALFTLVVALGLFVLGSMVFGWTNPGQNPPGGNVAAPLNAGSGAQAKSGNLTVNQLTASAVSGTAPFVVTSQTKVANLNADLLDGLDSSGFGDATLSNQSTILAKIGTSTDAANIDGSLHAGIQYLWENRSAIKSIQRGTITIGGNNTSNTATITAVDTTKTQLVFLGNSRGGTGGDHAGMDARIVLTNSTTITATRTCSNCGADTVVSFEVVEYW
jgi:hypothetical protein